MSFVHLVRAEWTKFRTIRGWVVAVVVAILALIAIGFISAEGSHTVAAGPGGQARRVLTGPGGEPVQDDFTFLHKTLGGDGSITVRVSSFTGVGDPLEPWAKAGIIMKDGTTAGSPYAALLLTGGHGVRMQYNFTGDIAGGSASASQARWLKLVRTGSTFTGYASPDGAAWHKIGSARVTGVPASAEVGMLVTSPQHETIEQHFGGTVGDAYSTQASAVFDNITLQGQSASADWTRGSVRSDPGNISANGGAFTIAGSGNIAPSAGAVENGLERTLVGTFAGLIVLIVIAVLFMTSEYRRGMIRTTFAASSRRGRVLAAKALVVGAVGFVAGLIASAIAVPLGQHLLTSNGNLIFAVSNMAEARLIVGTAAMLAVAAIFALAVGTLLRRSLGAVAAVIVLIVLPYLLVTAGILPGEAAKWVLRLTPAAAFSIQQTLMAYPQVSGVYTPAQGFFPLSPWGGFAVLCGYAVVALALATFIVRRRDV